jgi:hypothetical protein
VWERGKTWALERDFIASIAERDIEFLLFKELWSNTEFGDWLRASAGFSRAHYGVAPGIWSDDGAQEAERHIGARLGVLWRFRRATHCPEAFLGAWIMRSGLVCFASSRGMPRDLRLRRRATTE